MNLFKSAQRLDDAVLGRPDSSRGFIANLLMGLHPVMTPVWVLIGVACVIATVWQLARGNGVGALGPGLVAVVCAASAFASRRTPPHPPHG